MDARQGKDVDAMLPYLSRYMGHASLRQHLLLHSHLSRLHGRLRPDHPGQPVGAAGGRLRMRRDPATGAPDFFSFARDYLHAYMPRVRALSPKTIEAYRISLECFLGYLAEAEHIEREHVSFDHFDRQHLKAWLAWMTESAALRAEDRRAAPERRQGVPGLRRPGGHHPRRAQPGSQGPQSPGSAPQARRLPHRTRDTGDPRRVHGEDAEIPPEPDAAHPALRHRRARVARSPA